ncbi:MAG: HD domain-containing phosphohydrolase [Lachnospirales bacterium]
MNRKIRGKVRFSSMSFLSRVIIFVIFAVLVFFNFSGLFHIDRILFDNLYTYTYKDKSYDDIVTIEVNSAANNNLSDDAITEAYVKLINEDLQGATAVSFISDVQMSENLKNAIQSHGRVALAYEGEKPSEYIDVTENIGYYEVSKDVDGYARKYQLYKQDGNKTESSIVLETLTAGGYTFEQDGDETNLYIKNTHKYIGSVTLDAENSFYRVPLTQEENPFKSYSLKDVYEGKVPYGAFNGKIVVIGDISNRSDIVDTPITKIYSIQYIAQSITSLRESFDPKIVNIIIVCVIGGLLYFLTDLITMTMKPKVKILVPILFTIGVIVFNIAFAVLFDFVFSFSVPLGAIWIAFIVNIFLYTIGSERVAEEYKIPVNAMLQYDNVEASESYNYSVYMRIFEEHILIPAGISIETIEATKNNSLVKNVMQNSNKKEVLIKDGYIFIPLTQKNRKKTTYTILRYKKAIDLDKINYITALITSADMYFKYSTEGRNKEDSYKYIIEAMIGKVDEKDPTMQGHSKRVADTALQIGRLLMLSETDLDRLYFIALIHDIGKIGIPDDVLYKPSFYSEDDIGEIQKHPVIGMKMLELLSNDKDLISGILHHHERYDGKGYPDGLKGDEISQVARIIKIADVFDALISERQYKKKMPLSVACDVLFEGRGTEYDPEIVDVFIDDVKPKGWVPPKGDVKKPVILTEEISNKAKLLYKVYFDEVRDLKDDAPTSEEFAFDLSKGFGGLSFGNHYTEKNWLYNKPVCVKVSKDQKEMVYFNEDFDTGTKFTYFFKNGYLVSGAVASKTNDSSKDLFLKALYEGLGEPNLKNDVMELWDTNKFNILNFKSEEEGIEHIVIYINKFVM